jgi:hypothetical protein
MPDRTRCPLRALQTLPRDTELLAFEAGMSKDQVSLMCRGLDEQVRTFLERPS